MHGLYFLELQKYAQTRHGSTAWKALFEEAGFPERRYLAFNTYPDEEAKALVEAAARRAGTSAPLLLEDFGAFMIPRWFGAGVTHAKPTWRTLESLLKRSRAIGAAACQTHPATELPDVRISRIAEDRVLIEYDSPRRLCALLKGMARGIAAHYRERVSVTERRCMHEGAAKCEVEVAQLAG
ncbi:MAG: heme NO-binding domain-containing protein [bacterium]|nr:heme NO-binding domain-containing protein [bacterium]